MCLGLCILPPKQMNLYFKTRTMGRDKKNLLGLLSFLFEFDILVSGCDQNVNDGINVKALSDQ